VYTQGHSPVRRHGTEGGRRRVAGRRVARSAGDGPRRSGGGRPRTTTATPDGPPRPPAPGCPSAAARVPRTGPPAV